MKFETSQEFYQNIEQRYEEYYAKLLSFDNSTLDDRITKVASYYAFFGAVLVYAKGLLDDATEKHQFMVCEKKNTISVGSSTKVSDAKLESMVFTDPDVRNLRTYMNSVELKYELVKNLVSAIGMLKDMVVQASSNRRSEMKLN